MLDFKEIRRLVRLLENSEISEIEISDKDRKIRLAKPTITNGKPAGAPMIPVLPNAAVSASESSAQVQSMPSQVEVRAGRNIKVIKSPMVGTFYAAPSPDAEPYVQVGDTVHKGQVLCIVEAMKLMNEIESDFNGKILEVAVENAQPVEFDQPLFTIEAA